MTLHDAFIVSAKPYVYKNVDTLFKNKIIKSICGNVILNDYKQN